MRTSYINLVFNILLRLFPNFGWVKNSSILRKTRLLKKNKKFHWVSAAAIEFLEWNYVKDNSERWYSGRFLCHIRQPFQLSDRILLHHIWKKWMNNFFMLYSQKDWKGTHMTELAWFVIVKPRMTLVYNLSLINWIEIEKVSSQREQWSFFTIC